MSSAETSTIADDYTRSPNGKEKKRVQNRLAQRNYRQRLKAKLEALQEKVKVHEQHLEEWTINQSGSSALASSTAPTVVNSTCPTSALRHDSVMIVDFFISDVDGDCPPHEAAVIGQTAALSSNDLTVNLSSATTTCARKTSHALHALQGPPASVASCLAADLPGEFRFEDAFCSPQSLHDLGPNEQTQQHITGFAPYKSEENFQRNVDANAPVQDRIRYVMDQATAVGFETLDEAAVAYYTEIFEDTSPLRLDQRMSRNRQLPRFLSTLHNAAKNWSEWERRGFQEQITLGAEDILVEELNSFLTQHLISAASEEHAKYSIADKGIGNRKVHEGGRKVQDGLPNLWALTTALLAKTDVLKQGSRPDIVLTVIETLCFDRRENLAD